MRRRLLAPLTIAAVALLFTPPTPVHAVIDTLVLSPGGVAVSGAALGAGSQLRVPADGLVQRAVIAVPAGLRPTGIRADWQRSAEVAQGTLTVEQDGRSIGSADASSAPLVAEATTLAFRNARVIDNQFTFDLRLRPTGDRAVCSPLIESGAITLSNVYLTFDGDDTPSAVSDFLPPALGRLVISIPDAPSAAQSQAALTLANTAVRSFGLEPANIDVVTGNGGGDIRTMERRVIIDPAAPTGVTIDGRTARLGGSDDNMIKNASLFTDPARPLAQSSTAAVGTVAEKTTPNRDRYSFADLSIPPINLDGVGRVERTVNFSQANVGGAAHNWNVRVSGAYEPQIKATDATFSVLTNGTLLRSVPLNDSGALDVSVRIPDTLAGRDPSLTFRFDTRPTDNSCAAADPFSASISSSSSIDIERGNGSTPVGFTRWPQSALPTLHVAFDDRSVDAVAASMKTVATMQASTISPIAVDVVAMMNASLATPRLSVVTKNVVPDYLDAPLPGPGVRLVGEDGKELVSLRSDAQLSSLQAFEKNGAANLVLAGPTAGAIRSLADTLANGDNGWFALQGDTWFRSGDHAPSSIQARGSALRVEPIDPATSTLLARHRALFIVGGVIVVIALLGLLYPRMVHDRPVGPQTGAPGGRRATDTSDRPES